MNVTLGAIDSIQFARLSWDASTDPNFLRYEIERTDLLTETWHPVAVISLATTTLFDDYEARIGVQSAWRIRQVNQSEIASPWTGSEAGPVGTVRMAGESRTGLLFTTNVDPELNVAYVDVYGDGDVATRGWEFLDAEQTVLRSLYGVDNQVAFRPTEKRGVRFKRILALTAARIVRVPGMPVFDPLRRISTAALRHVCVRDHEGNRWWATLQVSEGAISMPINVYRSAVQITEVAGPFAATETNTRLPFPWSALSGRWAAHDDAAVLAKNDASRPSITFVRTADQDMGVSATVFYTGTSATNNGCGIVLRARDVANFLYLVVNPSLGTISAGKVFNGKNTTLWSVTGAASGVTLSAVARGDSLTGGTVVDVYTNGTYRTSFTVTESAYDGQRRAGLVCTNSPASPPTLTWDDFSVWTPDLAPSGDWEALGGSWVSDEGVARLWSGGTVAGRNVAVVETGYNDGQVQTLVSGADGARVVFRAVDADNYLAVNLTTSSDTVSVIKRIGGVETTVGSFTASTVGQTDVLVQFNGPDVRVRTSGVWRSFGASSTLVLTGDAATLASSRHGVGHSATARPGGYAAGFDTWSYRRVINLAVAGSTAGAGDVTSGLGKGGYVDVLRKMPPLGLHDRVLFMWGLNDIELGVGEALTAYEESITTVICRARSSSVHEATTAVSSVGWSSASANTNVHEGSTVLESTTVGAVAEYSLSSDYDGRPLDIVFSSPPATLGGGAEMTILVDGIIVASVSTDVWSAHPYYAPVVCRLVDIDPGAHVVLVVVDAVAGKAIIDSIYLEHPDPTGPLVGVSDVPRPTADGVDDAVVTAYNTSIASAVNAFGPRVRRVYANAAIGGDASMFNGGVVPNFNGALAVMPTVLSALGRDNLRLVMAGHEYLIDVTTPLTGIGERTQHGVVDSSDHPFGDYGDLYQDSF